MPVSSLRIPSATMRIMHRLILIIVGQALCCGVAAAEDHAAAAGGEAATTPAVARPSAGLKAPPNPRRWPRRAAEGNRARTVLSQG